MQYNVHVGLVHKIVLDLTATQSEFYYKYFDSDEHSCN